MKALTLVLALLCPAAFAYDYIPLENPSIKLVGSGVQWNKDYVVTAKHVRVADVAYQCARCDLQFIKREAYPGFPMPEWRERKAFERVTAVGNDSTLRTVQARGHDINIVRFDTKNPDVGVVLTTAQATQGMSGGPMFGADGKVIGITVSMITYSQQNETVRAYTKGRNATQYIPYSEIKRQWDIFESQLTVSK